MERNETAEMEQYRVEYDIPVAAKMKIGGQGALRKGWQIVTGKTKPFYGKKFDLYRNGVYAYCGRQK